MIDYIIKYSTITGLILDALGVSILLYNEIVLRKIDVLKSKGVTKDQVKNATKEDWKRGGGRLYNYKAMDLANKHTPRKAIVLSRLGLILLMIGFIFQIVSSSNN